MDCLLASVRKCRALFWKHLTLWVVAGAISGSLSGLLFKETGVDSKVFKDIVKTPGNLFTRGLKSILAPFVFCSMVCSVFKLKKVVDGNKIGLITVTYYICTTFLASMIAVGCCLVFIVPQVDPLDDSDLPAEVTAAGGSKVTAYTDYQMSCGHESEFWCKIRGTLENMVPSNIVDAMATSQLLGVMFFGVGVGVFIQPRDDGGSPIVELADEVQNVMIRLMYVLIAVTPIAVYSLLCWTVMSYDMSTLAKYIGWLLAAGVTSQLLQMLVVYPLLYLFFTRKNPIHYFVGLLPAMTTAFATASSAATFTWTMKCATQNNKIPSTIAEFVLPLGVTMNMDGTCMALVVSVFWLAYAQGLALEFGDVVLMMITAVVSSVGTAPVPSAALMYTGTIAEAVNVPLGSLFGVIVAVDWLRDRVRTVVNITGDSFAAGIIAHTCSVDDAEEEESNKKEGFEGFGTFAWSGTTGWPAHTSFVLREQATI